MQNSLAKRLCESHGVDMCFSTSPMPCQMDSSIEPAMGNVIPPVVSNSQLVGDDVGAAEAIDTNGKSVQKPKRKKIRPKVLKEGQPAKSRKPKTPNPPKVNGNQPTTKRKYVRRKGLNGPVKQPAPEGADTETRAEPGAAQRCLNVDGEVQRGIADLVAQTQVTEISTGPWHSQLSISGVERSDIQVCHWSAASSSISSVDPMAGLQELQVGSMPKRVAFDLNTSIINLPSYCSNPMDNSGQFFHYGPSKEVQTNQLLDSHSGMPVRNISHLDSSVNQMQHSSANFGQYVCTSESSTEKLARHDLMLRGFQMPENPTAPPQCTEKVSLRDNFSPEARLEETAVINQMAQYYRLPESPLAPPKHSKKDAMNGYLNEFSVKNDYLKFAANNYQIEAPSGFHESSDFSDVHVMGRKREHNAISGHQISFSVDFDNSNSARELYSDPLSTRSQTSYFPETCKRMRQDNCSNRLIRATGNFSSSSAFAGSWNTNDVSAMNPGVCTMADVQRLMALEKSRASQQMINFGMSENNMAQQHIKLAQQNSASKDFIALPDKQFRSFTVQQMQLPGSITNTLGQSNIQRNGINQPQPKEIRSSQHHSSDNFALPDKWSQYLTTGHPQLPSDTVNPSIGNYIQSNAIYQLQPFENPMVKGPVLLSEPHNTSSQDAAANNQCIAAITDEEIRISSTEVVMSLSQPSRQSARNENSHPDSSRLTAEANPTEKRKARGRPRKDAKSNGKPKDINSPGKENVGRAKRALTKGTYTGVLKTDGISCASEHSTRVTDRTTTLEPERYGAKTSNILKSLDHDKYSGITSEETHGGFISQSTALSFDPLDTIIQKIKLLSINRSDETVAEIPKNALVSYEAEFGALVPFEGKAKKNRSRAKVNIDPVTTLMWNLLMGPDMSDGAEGLDKDKEMWLEEERRIFRGRVDSFIARMHLVQGDRRFSPWKGSVVDSVVGVFLTQNVSDHLSSSAFMAVAAKYPPKSEVPERPAAKMSPTPEQNDCCSRLFGDSIKLQGKLAIEEIGDIRSSVTTKANEESNSNELTGSSSGYGMTRTAKEWPVSYRKSLTGSDESGPTGCAFPAVGFSSVLEAEDGSLEDVISSQNSAVSSQNSPGYLFQRNDPIGSSSLQNITEEGYIMREMFNGIGSSAPYTERPPMQDPGLSDRNAESSEYPELNPLPVSSMNKHVLLDLNRSYQPVHTSISYVQNSQPDFTGVSSVKHTENSFCADPDRANLSSDAQSEASLYQLPHASAMGNKNKTKITDSSRHFFCSINRPLSQEREPALSEPSQQNEFSPTTRQSFKLFTSSEKVLFSEDHSFCENHFSRNKTETPYVKSHGYSNLQELCTTTAKQMGGEQFLAGCSQLDNDVGVQTAAYGKHCSSIMSENKTSHLEVLEGFASASTQKPIDTQNGPSEVPENGSKAKKVRGRPKKKTYDWDSLRKEVLSNGDKQRSHNAKDTVDWETVRQADVREISETIRERGMNNMLAERIKEFLNRLVTDHGGVDLEWLRDVQPDKAKDYLLSIRGLGLKSVECVRLLTLHHMAFPVDTNVGRICVRLGWVPLQPLPESLQLHLLEMYPMLEHIQKYLWPRLCKLDQRTLYELHYQMITFGKVFCTKSKPNCNACPMRAECKHFASAFASARLALPGPEEKTLATSEIPNMAQFRHQTYVDSRTVGQLEWDTSHPKYVISGNQQPIIEEPPSPEPEPTAEAKDDAIEDLFCEDPDEIPTINLNIEEFTQNLKSYMQANNIEIEDADMSQALVAITPEAASLPTPKLKNVSRLRTEHQVYELPDTHPLLEGFDPREPDDPCPYLLSIWTPGETAQSTDAPKTFCNSGETGKLCGSSTCFSCNNIRETQAHKVRGTLLIPCRTAMRGSFPLNGTYFQVNEVFADHYSSQNPIDVPRSWIWKLPRRTVYFGTSIPTIFRGLTTEEIQQCFWRGFVCVRGFDRTLRAPRPLYARLHFPASKVARGKRPGATRGEE